MKKIILFLIFILLVSAIYCSELYKIEKFARQLMQEGEYYRAITEYKRLQSYYPDSTDYISNHLQIAKCYDLGNHYVEAISVYKEILAKYPTDRYSIYQIARLYTQNYDFYGSQDHIKSYKFIDDNSLLDSLRVINAINYVALNEQKMAISELNNINSPVLSEKKEHYLNLIAANFPIKEKKRSIAVLSSLIPGGGYFYSGYTQTGISALILDSLLGYLTFKSFDAGNDESAYVYGSLTAVFYLGGIYGSLQTVDKNNKKNKKLILKKFNMEEL